MSNPNKINSAIIAATESDDYILEAYTIGEVGFIIPDPHNYCDDEANIGFNPYGDMTE